MNASLHPEPGSDLSETHRLCVFELSLDCGHIATVTLNGWYPVSVACCDRLGGHWFNGCYYLTSSNVEYVRCLSERYQQRPAGTPREGTCIVFRRARTDEPFVPIHRWHQPSAGRFPTRVGAAVGLDRGVTRPAVGGHGTPEDVTT